MTADEYFERIGTGRDNAMPRPSEGYIDRELRQLINKANSSGKDCIINNGNGYYRPELSDETELSETRKYLNKELHRCREVAFKYKQMKLYIKDSMDRLEFKKWFERKERAERCRKNRKTIT